MPELAHLDLNAVILDTIASLVVVIDRSGRIVRFNGACERLTGYSFTEARGRNAVVLFVPPDERAPVSEHLSRLFGGEAPVEVENDWMTKDGRRRRIVWTNAVVRGGDGGHEAPVEFVIATGIDVTHRRIAEAAALEASEALRGSELRFRRMFESNVVGMIVGHADGRIFEANEAFLRTVGYSREDLLAGRVQWDQITPPEHAEADARCVRDLLERGTCQPFEKEYVRKDGSRVPVLLAPYAFDRESGLGPAFVLDLSDRRRAEQAERSALVRLRMVLEASRIAVWEWDPSTDRSFVAGDMTETYGVAAPDADELLNYVHAEDRDVVVSTVRRALTEDGPVEREFRSVRSDGEERWVRDVCRRRVDAEGRATLTGVSIDVTDRRLAERAQVESETRFRQMIENSPDVMFYQDIDLRTVWVSKVGPPLTLADVLGQTDEIFLGRTEHLRQAQIKRRVMETGVGERVETVAHVEGRGLIHLEVALERWQDADGKLRGIAGYARDITERKRAEEQMRALNESLEQRVAERTALIVQANDDLRRLAEHNRLLAREVEHRVRNNLASLLALVNVMADRAPDVPTFSRAMEGRLTAMAHTHRLLAEASWRPLDLRALVESALGAMRHLAPCDNPAVANGPGVLLPARHALPLMMVLAEWYTNSCKYGAHSAPGGRVDVSWDVNCEDGNGSGQRPDLPCGPSCLRVTLRWTETGGPPIRDSGEPSIGTDLVRGFVSRELAGTCELTYPPEGARHLIQFCPNPKAAEDVKT